MEEPIIEIEIYRTKYSCLKVKGPEGCVDVEKMRDEYKRFKPIADMYLNNFATIEEVEFIMRHEENFRGYLFLEISGRNRKEGIELKVSCGRSK